MPCCQSLLSVAFASASGGGTPSWLRRLHLKEGLSFPSHLHIDDLYAHPPPPPPPPPSINLHLAVVQDPPPKAAKHPNPKQQQQQLPSLARSEIPSLPNPTIPQPPPIPAVAPDLPDLPPPSSPPNPPGKKRGPRPRADGDDKDKKPKKRRRPADGGERLSASRTELTVFDTSSDGWKACKLLIRKDGDWKIRDWKVTEVSEPEDLSKLKRRGGLTSKLKSDRRKKDKKNKKKKEKDANLQLQGNIYATGGILMEYPGDQVPIQALKRPECSEPIPEGQSAGILHLQHATMEVERIRMG